jgi:hypothetical protein
MQLGESESIHALVAVIAMRPTLLCLRGGTSGGGVRNLRAQNAFRQRVAEAQARVPEPKIDHAPVGACPRKELIDRRASLFNPLTNSFFVPYSHWILPLTAPQSRRTIETAPVWTSRLADSITELMNVDGEPPVSTIDESDDPLLVCVFDPNPFSEPPSPSHPRFRFVDENNNATARFARCHRTAFAEEVFADSPYKSIMLEGLLQRTSVGTLLLQPAGEDDAQAPTDAPLAPGDAVVSFGGSQSLFRGFLQYFFPTVFEGLDTVPAGTEPFIRWLAGAPQDDPMLNFQDSGPMPPLLSFPRSPLPYDSLPMPMPWFVANARSPREILADTLQRVGLRISVTTIDKTPRLLIEPPAGQQPAADRDNSDGSASDEEGGFTNAAFLAALPAVATAFFRYSVPNPYAASVPLKGTYDLVTTCLSDEDAQSSEVHQDFEVEVATPVVATRKISDALQAVESLITYGCSGKLSHRASVLIWNCERVMQCVLLLEPGTTSVGVTYPKPILAASAVPSAEALARVRARILLKMRRAVIAHAEALLQKHDASDREILRKHAAHWSSPIAKTDDEVLAYCRGIDGYIEETRERGVALEDTKTEEEVRRLLTLYSDEGSLWHLARVRDPQTNQIQANNDRAARGMNLVRAVHSNSHAAGVHTVQPEGRAARLRSRATRFTSAARLPCFVFSGEQGDVCRIGGTCRGYALLHDRGAAAEAA